MSDNQHIDDESSKKLVKTAHSSKHSYGFETKSRLLQKKEFQTSEDEINSFLNQKLDYNLFHEPRHLRFSRIFFTEKCELFIEPKKSSQIPFSMLEYHLYKNNPIRIFGLKGTGKTTLVKKLLTEAFDHITARYIFYFDCNKIDLNKETTLLEFLLENIYINSQKKTLDYEMIKALEHSNRVTIVIDDAMSIESKEDYRMWSTYSSLRFEDSYNSSTDSFSGLKQINLINTGHNHLSKILNGEIMSKSKKIITCLLNPSFVYSKLDHENILLVGLNRDSQLEIIKSICETNEQNFEKHLQNHPGLLDFCYMPDICFLTGHCINEHFTSFTLQTSLPVSLTDIFIFLLDKLVSDSSSFDFNLLTKICDLSWHGIKNHRTEFDLSNLSEMSLKSQYLKNLNTKINGATLFLFKFSSLNTFHFSISLLEEFFAAIYLIFMMPFDEFKMLISTHFKLQIFDLDNYQNKHITRFMFGLCNEVTLKHLLKINSSFFNSTDKMSLLHTIAFEANSPIKTLDNTILQHLAWVHELQNHSNTQNLASRLSNEIKVHCEFCQEDISALFYVMQARKEPVTITALSNNDFIDDSWKLFFILARSASIKMLSLDLSRNKFGNEGAAILSQCLNNVKQLILQRCDITAPGVEIISNKIRELDEPMLSLNLSWNIFGNEGAAILSQCLNNVKQLILQGCDITAPGVEIISNKIRELDEPMLSLDLSWNKFGNEGAAILSTCLNNVKQLILEHCDITAPGVEIISNKIRELDEPIESLNFYGNKVGNKGFTAISLCLGKIVKLRIGDYYDSEITMEGIKTILSANEKTPNALLELKIYCESSTEKEAKKEARKYQLNIWINCAQVSFKVENVKNSEEILSEYKKQVESVQKHLINEAGRLSDIDPPQYLYETIQNIDIQLCENLDNLQSTSAQSCETVNLSHLFCSAYNKITQQGSRKIPEESQLFVAVVGSAGSGKTTIKKTLLNKYHTEKCLYGFDFVFCIRCSYTILKHQSNLLEFLVKTLPHRWLKNNQICSQVLKQIEKNHKLCIIFDDFNFSDMSFLNKCSDDDVNEQVQSAANFIRNILSGKLLSNAFKFVCFRPLEFSQYMRLSYRLRLLPKIVYVSGVNQNNQDKILHSICGNKFEKIKTYQEAYTDFRSLCDIFANNLAVVKSITGHVECIDESFDPLLCIPLTSVVVSSFVMIIWNCVFQHDTIDLSEVVNFAWKKFSKKQIAFDQVNLSHDHNEIINVFLQICAAQKYSNIYYLTFPSIVFDCFIAMYLLYFHDSFDSELSCLLDRKSFSDKTVKLVFGLCNRSTSIYLEKLFPSLIKLSYKLSSLENAVINCLNNLEKSDQQFISTLLFLCCLVFEMHDIEFAGRVADCLPNNIDISNGIATAEIAGLSFVLLERTTEICIVFSTRSMLNCIKLFENTQKIITERNSFVRFLTLEGRDASIDAFSTYVHL